MMNEPVTMILFLNDVCANEKLSIGILTEQLQPIILEKNQFAYEGWSYVNAVLANFGYSGFYGKGHIARR